MCILITFCTLFASIFCSDDDFALNLVLFVKICILFGANLALKLKKNNAKIAPFNVAFCSTKTQKKNNLHFLVAGKEQKSCAFWLDY